MTDQRRWSVRVRDVRGAEQELHIAVPGGDGIVWAWMGLARIQLDPKAVSELVAAYRQAQAVALQDRGRF